MFNRSYHFTSLHRRRDYRITHSKDVVLVNKRVLHPDGHVETVSDFVVDNSSDELERIPAYSSKIEYMQMYGTLYDNLPVKLPALENQINMLTETEIIRQSREIMLKNEEVVEKPQLKINKIKNVEELVEEPSESQPQKSVE